MKVLRQDVLEETTHELMAVEARRAPECRFAMLVADCDAGVATSANANRLNRKRRFAQLQCEN